MEAENVKVSFSFVCPRTGEVAKKEASFEALSYHTINSRYEDCGYGYRMTCYVNDCSECHKTHDVTIYEDKPFGA